MDDVYRRIESIILNHNVRGMDVLRGILPEGYCLRAAQLILENKGTVLIGTGFPVRGTYETDGPIGAICLYNVLKKLSCKPVFVCAPPIAGILQKHFDTEVIPILNREDSLPHVLDILEKSKPSLVMSVERPGAAEDGRYYNMRGDDITDFAAKYDLFFELAQCPSIAFGDGGNEIGMGNVLEILAPLPITPSVTTCDELIVATVSNWGVYGVIAALSHLTRRDLLSLSDPHEIASYLIQNGSLDGVTARAETTEDGFPIQVGMGVIEELKKTVAL